MELHEKTLDLIATFEKDKELFDEAIRRSKVAALSSKELVRLEIKHEKIRRELLFKEEIARLRSEVDHRIINYQQALDALDEIKRDLLTQFTKLRKIEALMIYDLACRKFNAYWSVNIIAAERDKAGREFHRLMSALRDDTDGGSPKEIPRLTLEEVKLMT